jgi:hypothetical protein
MDKDDGGPAFPSKRTDIGQHNGMSLRDYFAAKAMASLIIAMGNSEAFSQRVMQGYPDRLLTEAVAALAYKHADDMLWERS